MKCNIIQCTSMLYIISSSVDSPISRVASTQYELTSLFLTCNFFMALFFCSLFFYFFFFFHFSNSTSSLSLSFSFFFSFLSLYYIICIFLLFWPFQSLLSFLYHLSVIIIFSGYVYVYEWDSAFSQNF